MLAVALALVSAGRAEAAVYTLTGEPEAKLPDLAVDAAGTAHVAWARSVPNGDDVLVYCRVPRGATQCAATLDFQLPGDNSWGTRVVLSRDGSEVWLLEPRCCSPVLALHSADGGQSFGAAQTLSSEFAPFSNWEAVLGPGDFSFSLTAINTGPDFGGIYQAIPMSGETTPRFQIADFPKGYYSSTGFPDPTSPIVAYSDLESLFFRRWSGSGDYNDPASWSAEAAIGPGDEPKLTSGPRGVYMIYSDREAHGYQVRRYDPVSASFGPATLVSDPEQEGPTSRDFEQDGGGTLHAVFKERPADEWQVRHRISTDGTTWQPIDVLATEDQSRRFFNLRVGAAPDGGGAVVADENSEGPIYFMPFEPSGGGGTACPPSVKVGEAVVRALEGCFERSGKRYVASGPVKVNGVDIEPAGGKAGAAAAFQVTVDKGKRTLETSSTANVRAGGAVLERGPLAWRLPTGAGKVMRLNSPDGSVFRDLGKFAKQLFDFPVDGDAELLIGKGETAKIPTAFRLPGLIGGVSGNVTLKTNAGGLDLGGLKIKAPAAEIGLLRIGDIDVTYSGADTFTGSAKLQLPPAYADAFGVGFGFADGRLNFVHVDRPFDPALPIVGSPPSPIVGLDFLAFDYLDQPGSRKFVGSVILIGGPELGSLRAVELDGNVTVEFPASGPATIGATGELTVVIVPFASGSASYRTDGLLSFDGSSFEFPPDGMWSEIAGFSGSVDDGWASVSLPLRFSAAGSASASLGPFSGTGTTVISSKGVTGCVEFVDPPGPIPAPPDLGVSYEWGDTFPSLTCNVGSFKLAKPAAGAGEARAAQAGEAVLIEGGLPRATIAIEGEGGAPAVTLTAPNGEQITTTGEPQAEGRFIAQPFGEASTTYISIAEPPAGAYGVEEQAGSAPIARIRVANGIPDPKVSAKVSGRGRQRTLRYRVRAIPGQRVSFAEQSRGGLYRELGRARPGRGSLRFRPADSAERKRQIVALVEQDGAPRARPTVARYTAPKPKPPAAPKRVRVRRRGSRMQIGWSPVRGARGYRVRAVLPRDGRRLLFFPSRRKRTLTVGGVERNDRATVTVQAIGPDARPGRPKRSALRPARGGRRRR